MTTYTGMTKKRSQEEYSPEELRGLLMIVIAAVLVAVFAGGIATGMLINKKEYERRDNLRMECPFN